MAHSAVPRRSGAVVRGVPRGLDEVGAGWTGRLTIAWTFTHASPLVVGSGRLVLAPTERRLPTRRRIAGRPAPPEAEDELLLDVVRRGADGMPVIPGSSLKGAVRQVYELLTASCDVHLGPCKPKAGQPSVCPACSLFGGRGWAARVGFLEAVPAGERWSHQVVRRDVPQAWEPKEPVPGTVRVYGGGVARNREGEAAREEKTFAVHGAFTSRVRVSAAGDDELGLLFASLGIGWSGRGPGLRLGGRKFHGFGAAGVRLLAAERWRPWAAPEPVADAEPWAVALRDRALADPARQAAWQAIHLALADTR